MPVSGFLAPALEIAVTDNFNAPSAAPISPEATEKIGQISPIRQPDPAGAAPSSSDSSAMSDKTRSGFTREEELFRTRWGWAAYDDVQRAAFETARQSE